MKFIIALDIIDEAETCIEIAERLESVARVLRREGDVEIWTCGDLNKPNAIRVRDEVVGTWSFE
jgi:hypothetical protein